MWHTLVGGDTGDTLAMAQRRFHLSLDPWLVARTALAEPGAWVVLTPNSYAARALRAAPRSLRHLAEAVLASADPPQATAPSLLAQRSLCAAVRQVVGGEYPERLATVIRPALARFLRAGADLEFLASLDHQRARVLAQVAQRHRDCLARRGLVDGSELLHRAAELLERVSSERRQLLVYGYDRLVADEVRFLNALAGADSVVVLPWSPDDPGLEENRALADSLQAEDWATELVTDSADASPGERLARRLIRPESAQLADDEAAVQSWPDQRSEIRGVLAQVKALLRHPDDTLKASDVVLISRDEESYAPLVTELAAELGVPVNTWAPLPLARTRVGTWVKLLLEACVSRFPFETTVRLLAHPLSGALTPDLRATAFAERYSGGDWRRAETPVSKLPPPPASAVAADWRAWLRGVLEAWSLREKAVPWALELRALDVLDDLLRNGADDDEPEQAVDLRAFAAELDESLAAVQVRCPPARGGVDLHTQLSVYGARYRHVFVLGAVEGSLPQPLQPDPWLDYLDRDRLSAMGVSALDGAVEAAQHERMSFLMTLLSVGERLVVSYPRVLGRAATEPSAFLARLGLPEVADPTVPICSLPELRRLGLRQTDAVSQLRGDMVVAVAAAGWAIEMGRLRGDGDPAYRGDVAVPLPTRALTVSELQTLGQCPFRFWAERVLHLDELDSGEPEPSRSRLGSLLHQVLCWSLPALLELDESAPATDRFARFDQLLELAMARALGQPTHGASELEAALARQITAHPLRSREAADLQRLTRVHHWPLLAQELLATLRRGVRSPDLLRAGARPLAYEQEVEGEWEQLPVIARIDRIDERPGKAGEPDRVCLVDYKLGSSIAKIKGANGRLNVHFQIPVYQRLYASSHDEGPVDGCYFLFGTAEQSAPSASAEDQEKLAAELARFGGEARARVAGGSYPVAPDVDLASCAYCVCAGLCRVAGAPTGEA